jgi:4-alpha-glucanotransferase
MKFNRASGVLLHPTSLPGEFGIGDLGSAAYAFIDFLVEAKQSYWQILPLGPTGYGDSPYQSFSAFAGNTLLISPERLVEDGLITDADLKSQFDPGGERVDYGAVYDWKNELLWRAFYGLQHTTNPDTRDEFEKYCEECEPWLADYALYRSIKLSEGQNAWYRWPEPLKTRDKQALQAAAGQLSEQIQAQKFYQFLFFRQWTAVKEYANSAGIKIIGDMPIFVAHDSADVWANQESFKLKADGTPLVVAGVPPDYFSTTGQLWGNPIYKWDAMAANGFRWWIERVRSTLQIVDIIRVDHFRGFAASWEVPGTDKTAKNGQWVTAPGLELFSALESALGPLPVIAEDLGDITPDVRELLDLLGFPGMRILQYAFGGGAKNLDLPHNYIRNCAAYTGTHDNDTVVGWFLSRPKAVADKTSGERAFCLEYLDSDGLDIHWDFIRAVWSSVADTAITPLPDLLGLGTEGRTNLPASTSGNWQWRMQKDAITDAIIVRLRKLTEIYGRATERST